MQSQARGVITGRVHVCVSTCMCVHVRMCLYVFGCFCLRARNPKQLIFTLTFRAVWETHTFGLPAERVRRPLYSPPEWMAPRSDQTCFHCH